LENYLPGKIEVKTWADDKKSAFSMTFDDGFQAHYTHARRILNEFGFKGSFYVNPHTLKETKKDADDERYAYWFQLVEMAQEGHEIGSHSFSHPHLNDLDIGDEKKKGTLLYELSASKRKIEEMVPEYKCITMAYPFGFHNSEIDRCTEKHYEAARSAGSKPNNASLTEEEFMNLNSKLILWKKKRNKIEDDMVKLKRFVRWIEKKSISQGQWAILVAHEVLPFSELNTTDSFEPTSNEWLRALCEWLEIKSNENSVWIDTVANITKYMKERDHFSYDIISQSENDIKIRVTTNLYKKVFNYPLTVDIVIPESWDSVIITQNSSEKVYDAKVGVKYTFVTTKIIPDGRVIKLKKKG
jgi:hypothetical protein